jgi:ATP-dependent DNA helicase PIF1
MNTLPIECFSKEQAFAYHKFTNGENLFITGPGGSGKTQLIHSFIDYCNLMKIEVSVCALTGCAAVLLNKNAKTIHSWSGIKLANGTTQSIIEKVFRNELAVNNWKRVQVLIIDEISMMSVKILDLLEQIARGVRKTGAVFGGIQVVFTGDFYQLPPIGNINEPTSCQFCFQSKKWNKIFSTENSSIILKTIFRQKDPVFQNILNEIRVGELSDENASILQSRVGCEHNGDEIYTRLFPIKSKVDIINKHNFEKLDVQEYTQEMFIKRNCKFYIDSRLPIIDDVLDRCNSLSMNEMEFEIKRLASLMPTDETVKMKLGAIVMLTFNVDVENGLCNGSQGIIVDILKKQTIKEHPGLFNNLVNIPVVRFNNGIVCSITPRIWQSEDYPCICVGQLPLILAWALTIHKSQGASLDFAEVDAGSSIFEYGQTYVGISRVRSLNGLYLTNFHQKRIKAHPLVKSFYEGIHFDIPDGWKGNERVLISETTASETMASETTAIEMVNEEIPIAEAIVERIPYGTICVKKI